MIESSGAATKRRILDAAERLFADNGVAGTSLRAIIFEAGVNLAAIHYHFGSKEGLLRAVVGRRADPMNHDRIQQLAHFREISNGRPSLEQVVEAFVGPPLRLGREPDGGAIFMRLMGRLLSEPGEFFRVVVPEKFQAVAEAFLPALAERLPHLSPAELHWRLHFTIGLAAHTMRIGTEIAFITGGLCDGSDVEQVIAQVVAFVSAGLRAPSAPATNSQE